MEFEHELKPSDDAIIVSAVSDNLIGHENPAETQRSLLELRELLRTLNVSVHSEFIQNKKKRLGGHQISCTSINHRKNQQKIIPITKRRSKRKIIFFVFEYRMNRGFCFIYKDSQ